MGKKTGSKKTIPKTPVGRQFKTVMKEYGSGKLRDPHGKPITNQKQALRVAFEEQRAAKSRGTEKRTFKGRTRVRPKLKKKG